MSDTPRTDAVVNSLPQNERGEITLKGIRNLINCCAELERELAEARDDFQQAENSRKVNAELLNRAENDLAILRGQLSGVTKQRDALKPIVEAHLPALQILSHAGELEAQEYQAALAAVKGGAQ